MTNKKRPLVSREQYGVSYMQGYHPMHIYDTTYGNEN